MKPQAFIWEEAVPNLGLATGSAEKYFWFFPFLFVICGIFFFKAPWPPSGPGPSHCRVFAITLRRTTLGRTPLDEWSAQRTDLYLTKTQHSEQTFMPRWDSNPQYRQSSGRKSTPSPARQLGLAFSGILPERYQDWLLRNSSISLFVICAVI